MNRFNYFFFLFSVVLIVSCSTASKNETIPSNAELDELINESYILTKELDFEGAFSKLNHVLVLSKENQNIEYEIKVYLNLGRLLYNFNEKEQALNYFLKSLELAEKSKIDTSLSAIYNNLAISYIDNHYYTLAEEYFKKALSISLKKGLPEKIALNLINIAAIKEEMNQLDSALYYSERSLSILEENKIIAMQSSCYNNIGQILFKEKKYDQAKVAIKKALDLEFPAPDQAFIGIFELNLGKTFVQLNQYDSAYKHLNKALIYLVKTNNYSMLSDCNYWLYKNEFSINKVDAAQVYFENCLNWKDSVLFQNEEQWLLDVKMKYEFGKKESEIAFLEERSTLKNRIIIVGAFFSLLFILFLLSVWNARNKNLKQRNIILKKEKELSKVEMEKNEVQRLKLKDEIENQKKLSQIKHEQIRLELEHKNKELVSNAVHLMNKNEILNSLLILLEQIETGDSERNNNLLDEMQNSIKNNIHQDKSWEDFKLHFDQVHESFSKNLNLKHPDLSPTEFRLCAYLLIGLNPKEIAHVSNISPESVRKRKQRLRQKLNIDPSIDLNEYLKSL
jgi:tetratricopeptide (TPR) repeat protein